MTLVSFTNKVKYGGVLYSPHSQIEVDDVDVAEMVAKGAHVLQHFDGDVEEVAFEDVPDGETVPVVADVVPDSTEPLPDEDDELGDEDDAVVLVVEKPVVVPPVAPAPSRRSQLQPKK